MNKKRGHLRDYLEATQDYDGYYPSPTCASLETAQFNLKTKVSKNAPTKEYKEYARLRQSAQVGKRPFYTVGLEHKNPTKRDLYIKN